MTGMVESDEKRNPIIIPSFVSQQSHWTGLLNEMELLPASHPRVKCDGCAMYPISGSRFKCKCVLLVRACVRMSLWGSATNYLHPVIFSITFSESLSPNPSPLFLPIHFFLPTCSFPAFSTSGKICDDYDYCESCFQSKASHRHPFMRIAEPDSNPIYVGRPGKRKGFGGNRRNTAGGDGADSHGQLLEVRLGQQNKAWRNNNHISIWGSSQALPFSRFR